MQKIMENFYNNTSIILTASVNPNKMPDSPFSAKDREKQYLEALEFYAKKYEDINSIVFAENSNWNLDYIKSQLSNFKNIIFLSFNNNNFDRTLGKGYGELQLLSKSLESDFYPKTQYIIKITGRLKILNLEKLISQFNSLPISLLCDSKTVNIFFWNKDVQPIHTDTRCFIIKKDFFEEHLKSSVELINEKKGFYFENLLHKVAQNGDYADKIMDRFCSEPIYSGYGAHMGGKNYNSKRQKIKNLIRNIIRKIFPQLKI